MSPSTATVLYISTLAYKVLITAVVMAGIFLIFRFGLPPLATIIVGQDTNFNINIAFQFSAVANIALTGGLVFSEVGRRKAVKRLKENETSRRGGGHRA